jgi:hypothetical protein
MGQQWQPNNNGSPTMMATQQQWRLNNNGCLVVDWVLLVRVQASPEGLRKSMRQYAIATRASEGASVARGKSQEHKAILDCKQARENLSVSRETPQEHKAILDREAKGESKGSTHAPPRV